MVSRICGPVITMMDDDGRTPLQGSTLVGVQDQMHDFASGAPGSASGRSGAASAAPGSASALGWLASSTVPESASLLTEPHPFADHAVTIIQTTVALVRIRG